MIKASIYIFAISIVSIILTRLVPHPPNFTSTIAVATYFPILFGKKNILFVMAAFIISDLMIGFHSYIFWTWGSLLAIGLLSKYFENISNRILTAASFSFLFFIITNFGIWVSGQYEYSFQGIAICYFMALPFFAFNLASTIFYSFIIEIMISFNRIKTEIAKINPLYFEILKEKN